MTSTKNVYLLKQKSNCVCAIGEAVNRTKEHLMILMKSQTHFLNFQNLLYFEINLRKMGKKIGSRIMLLGISILSSPKIAEFAINMILSRKLFDHLSLLLSGGGGGGGVLGSVIDLMEFYAR